MSLFIALIIAFVVTFILMPMVIKVSKSIDLLDIPDRRKIHSVGTPSFGGIAVFTGFLISLLFSVSLFELSQYKFFLGGMLLIFLLGVRDDVSSLQAKHKILVQLLSSFLVVYFAGIKLEGFYGLFGLTYLPRGLSEIISIFMIMVMTNSFNLLDGIDGLAGSIAVVILGFFVFFFIASGQSILAVCCVSLIGAILAFLFFNWYPSQVFMGDTGSMFLGFVVSVLTIVFIDSAFHTPFVMLKGIQSPVAIAVAALILPIYDTLRVFTIRIKKGKSPLAPDRNHIHHSLLNLGFDHSKATVVLVMANILNIGLALSLDGKIAQELMIIIEFGVMAVFGLFIDVLAKNKRKMELYTAKRQHKSLYVSKSA